MLSLVFLSCLISILPSMNGANIGHAADVNYYHNKRITESRRSTTTVSPVLSPQCGNRSASLMIATKIIGGGPSVAGEWPWMAALYFGEEHAGKVKKSDASLGCGGSLISDQWVLTAAHCLPKPYESSQLTFVRLGDVDLRDTVNDGAKPVDVPVKRFIRHSDYNEVTSENDIGLVRLNKKVKFTENIYPICLLSGQQYMADQYYHGKIGTIAGWGVTQNKSPSKVLKHTDVTLGDCAKNRKLEQAGEAKLDYRVFCAGDTENDSCQGDSGGPLMLESKTTDTYFQAGIVSFGQGCAVKNYPGVYTKVPAFIKWINEQTGLKF